jgi:hypothetical protein
MSEGSTSDSGWPSPDRATLQELRDLFASSGGQFSALEALNAEFRRRKSDDETNVLHAEAALALARAPDSQPYYVPANPDKTVEAMHA